MLFVTWVARLLRDVVLFSVVNRSYVIGGTILAMLFLGALILGAEASAPFIYTLF